MSAVGAKIECPVCHKVSTVTELIPMGVAPNMYIQKLSCGHEGKITIPDH